MIIFNKNNQRTPTYFNKLPTQMNIKVLIVEDNPITAQDIEEMLLMQNMQVVGHAHNSQQAINKALNLSPDVILMDINLEGEVDGIDTVKIINKTQYFPVVYLTANTDRAHVEKAYDTSPAAFIAKPFYEKDLIHAIELAFIHHCQLSFENNSISEMDKVIFLKSGDQYEKVEIKNIRYIEADGSYSKVVTKEKSYSISINLQALSKKINYELFFRVHRSYIVNIEEITGFDNHCVFINDLTIPYSKSHKEALMSHLHKL